MGHWTDSWGVLKPKPCHEALDWAKTQPDWGTAWLKCERGDWMLHRLARNAGEWGSIAHRKLVLAACECARTALPYVEQGEERPMATIELAERWARGDEKITTDQLRIALFAVGNAYYASASAAAYAAVAAAYAAAYADAASASAAAAYAASAAAANAAYAASAAARKKALGQCADIIRKHYPQAPEVK